MINRTTLAASAALAVATAAAAGCDAGGEEDRVRETFRAFHSAVAKGDGKHACSMLTDRARAALERDADLGALNTCPEIVAWSWMGMSQAEKTALRKLDVGHVGVDGDRATIRPQDIELRDAPEDLEVRNDKPIILRRTPAGAWKFDEVL